MIQDIYGVTGFTLDDIEQYAAVQAISEYIRSRAPVSDDDPDAEQIRDLWLETAIEDARDYGEPEV